MLTNVEAKFTIYILNEKKIIFKKLSQYFNCKFCLKSFFGSFKKHLHLLNTFINIFQ